MRFLGHLLTVVLAFVAGMAGWLVAEGQWSSTTERADAPPAFETGAEPAIRNPPDSAAEGSGNVPELLVSTDALIIPVQGVAKGDLIDTFGEPRGSDRAHEGIDIMAPAGTSVLAITSGTIEKLFVSEAGGQTIYLRSKDRRTVYYYAHLAGYASGLAEGDTVRAGQPIGTVGSSGNADPAAPHLHFEVKVLSPDARWHEEGRIINPYKLLTQSKN